jgi:hypothetical protein
MNFLKTTNEIDNWLKNYNINNYKILTNYQSQFCPYVVDVDEDVDISYQNLKIIPIKFRIIYGYFDCSYNQLTNLLFSPQIIYGYFYINNNKIQSLKKCPQDIKGMFDCSSNLLDKKSIIYLSKNIKDINISKNNQLEYLYGKTTKEILEESNKLKDAKKKKNYCSKLNKTLSQKDLKEKINKI